MDRSARFPQRIYRIAAIYGFVVLLPQYFLEALMVPPPNYPEQFYGFIGVALAWQFVFLLIAHDVTRYYMLIPVTVLEKLAFGLPAIILFMQGRAPAMVAIFGSIDLLFATLFALSLFIVRRRDMWGNTR